MSRELAHQVADAVLYEGYMLYPYRPSAIKNRQRWSFGILYPNAYSEVPRGTERSAMHSECLFETTPGAALHMELRFLHLLARQVEQSVDGRMKPVPSLVVDGQRIETWDEAVARSVEFSPASLQEPQLQEFAFEASSSTELLRESSGDVAGRVRREQREVRGSISISTRALRPNLLKLSIDVSNSSAFPGDSLDRNSALLSSLLSAHTILTLTGGEFVSLLDPPADLRDSVSACRNEGNFPVLVGQAPARDTMLCSPIVLYDYPQIAPESAGNFFDATEMDEMLTLRVMTLTDDEKDEMRHADGHVRSLLQRTEESAREQLMRTHGTIRGLRPVQEEP